MHAAPRGVSFECWFLCLFCGLLGGARFVEGAEPAAGSKVPALFRPLVGSALPDDLTLGPGKKEGTLSKKLPPLKLKAWLPPDAEITDELRTHLKVPGNYTKPVNQAVQLTLGPGDRTAVQGVVANNDRIRVEIERPNRMPVVPRRAIRNLDAAKSHKVPQLRTTYAICDGDGLLASVFDGGAILHTHREFMVQRVSLVTPKESHFHATHVAGTMAAAGVLEKAQGMAPKLKLLSHDWDDDLSQIAILPPAVIVTNHSYGPLVGWDQDPGTLEWFWWGDRAASPTEDAKFGKYDANCSKLDELLRQRPGLLVVVAAGNDRDNGPEVQPVMHRVIAVDAETGELFWDTSSALHERDGFDHGGLDTIAGLGLAKNAICVGAIYDLLPSDDPTPASEIKTTEFSSWGPADDARIKPDVVANGFHLISPDNSDNEAYNDLSGTSMASPVVSGISCLLHQLFVQKHGRKPTAAELKAILIHSATDAGEPGPDPKFGWGSINAFAAGRLIDSKTGKVVANQSVKQGTTEVRKIASSGEGPLKITVVWTDPAALPNVNGLDDATATLVNNLDCRLTAPDNHVFYPFSLKRANPLERATATGPNQVDNVEMIVAPPLAGEWKLEIQAPPTLKDGERQAFALIVSGGEVQQPVDAGAAPNESHPAVRAAVPAVPAVRAAVPLGPAAASEPQTTLVVIFIQDESVPGLVESRKRIERQLKNWYTWQKDRQNPAGIFYSETPVVIPFAHGRWVGKDREFTSKELQTALGQVPVDKNTAVLCYFSGHGMGKPDGRLLLFDRELGRTDPNLRLGSNTLLQTWTDAAVRPRLAVLVTDCCSEAGYVVDPRFTDFPAGVWDGGILADLISPSVKGSMHWASSTYRIDPDTGDVDNEVSWAPESGSVFGDSFADLLAMPKADALGKSTAKTVDWKLAFDLVSARTHRRYEVFRTDLFNSPAKAKRVSEADILHLFRQATQRPQAVVSKLNP